MKRCTECGREYDNTMMFCLDDGAELLYGPRPKAGVVGEDEPATAILHETFTPSEAATREQIHTTNRTAILPTGTGETVVKPSAFDKRLLAIALLFAIIAFG